MDFLTQLFKGVANERRLEMLELLLDEKEVPIEEIASRLKIPEATCCRNLKILERVHIVRSHRRNERVFYSRDDAQGFFYNRTIIDLIRRKKAGRTLLRA
jgi:DNA-binding transcriptional ArsR family regulator